MCIWTIGLERRQKRPQIAGLKYKFGIEYWTSNKHDILSKNERKKGGKRESNSSVSLNLLWLTLPYI